MHSITEHQSMETALKQLTGLLRRHIPATGTHPTAIPSLTLMAAEQLSEPMESVYKPSICVVAQGAKTATLAGRTFRYDPSAYLITSVELPVIGRVIEASPEKPYLSLKLSFDTDMILDIIQTMEEPDGPPAEPGGISTNAASKPLLEAIVRLVQLLDTPQDIPVLSPLFIREILYRILQSEQGLQLRQFAVIGSYAHNISLAIRQINRDYNRPFAVEALARSVQMSASAFHKHFKRITAMSPLQYQKTVRLQEARRLMLTEAVQAADAAYLVGYESPSQFSREYARMYGRPPQQDVQALQQQKTKPLE
ncbi:AraC family transcriptional regulator ['Paenibacillus yunnanensis' Narsing Rao et al. 2020]|uniref:AraC family transcriptional regulator n=1 Tax=Paenibacillus tengchongensis TaxID=2608684 RepID=UPI00124D7EAB|nr:AraC family transcriptional regulator [Paenibacillus tengchongensis]